jgi:MSHA biogenesis protein MshQ
VELLDASDNSGALDASGCRSTWTTIQTLATNPNFVASDNGRKTVSFQEANAWKDVRVRVTYPATGTASAVGCSNDNFAIRPLQFGNVAVSDQNWTTAGTARGLSNTSASGGVVHKAGQPISLSARAVGALGTVTTNYADTPAAAPLACILPTGCVNGTLGTFAVGASAVAGVLASNNASYSEVGAFSLQLVDANFAAVDLADGSTAAERDIGSAAINVGRFVPDHFDLVANNAPQFKTFNDASCAGRSFTYIGQPFGYVTAPQAAVVAKNAAGATTVNYANDLWKLAAAGVTQTYTSVPATPVLITTLGAPVITSNNNGTGFVTADTGDTLTYTRVTAAPFPAPFNANIALAMSVQDSAENGANQGIVATITPATFNGGGAGIAFDAGNAFRYGRLRSSNAHGSERLALNVPVRAEYFNGSLFVTNAGDSCTRFTLATDLALANYQRNLNAGETMPGPANVSLAAGVSAIALSAPAVGAVSNSGSVDLTLTVPNWLRFNWSGAVGDPKARATFGVYRNANELIYLREAY